MPPYHPRRKFDFDDGTIIVSEAMSRKINFVIWDMGARNICQKPLKNPHVNKKNKNSVHKCPPMEDTKWTTIQKKSQVMALRKRV
jgi:hypothetical protein